MYLRGWKYCALVGRFVPKEGFLTEVYPVGRTDLWAGRCKVYGITDLNLSISRQDRAGGLPMAVKGDTPHLPDKLKYFT